MGVQINGSEGNVIATKGTYSGNVTIGGTLTYEDVTNIDSVGLVTARNGIEIGARPGVAASISVDGNMVVSGITTIGELISSYGTIVRSVNDNGITIAGGTASNSGANVTVYGGSHGSYPDTVRFRIDGSEKVRIDSSGKFGIGMSADQITALKGKLDIDASGIDAAGDTDDPNDYAIVIRNSSSTNSGNGIAFTNDSGAAVGGAIIHIDKGSNNIGDLSFLTSASSNTPEERLRITSDGKIGIGEDDPDGNYLLIRAASTVGTTKGHIMLTGDSATVGQGPQIVFSESGSASSFAGAYIGHMREGSNSTGNLVFGTRATGGDASTVPTERLRITSAGRVGIGENSPDTPLHISTPAATTCEIRLTSNNTGSSQGDRGRINVYSAKNDGTAFNAGYIDIDRASGTETTAQMTFNLNNGSGVTEWVRIEPTGRILAARNTSGSQALMDPGVILDRQDSRVGTNSNTFNGVGIIKDSNAWGTALYIKRTSNGAGTGFFCEFAYATLATSGTTIGSIANNGNSNVSYNTSSDYRLKQDISSITDAISSLKKLTPRKFRWKNDLDLGYQDGFIAHEVQETGIFNHLVTGEKDGTEEDKNDPDTIIPAYQQMDYSKLTPTLVAAVQELSAKVETLEAEIAALKSN